MKHEAVVTVILIGIFALSQAVGLYLVAESVEEVTCEIIEGRQTCLASFEQTAIGQRPQTEGGWSVLYIVFGVTIGTLLLLLLAKYNKQAIWKTWFFIAVWITTAIALGVVFPPDFLIFAWLVAFLLTAWKIFKPNVLIYNLTEILMYSGMAVLLVPIMFVKDQQSEFFSVWPIFLLLIIISLYDVYAVWKSKHMVKMATFITGSNAFAGLMVPYKVKQKKLTLKLPKDPTTSLGKESSHKNAILGGGDVTFPLLFAGTVLQARTVEYVRSGMLFIDALHAAYWHSLLIGLGAAVAIAFLFIFAKKDKFYPAMPVVTAGCLLGWGISFLL